MLELNELKELYPNKVAEIEARFVMSDAMMHRTLNKHHDNHKKLDITFKPLSKETAEAVAALVEREDGYTGESALCDKHYRFIEPVQINNDQDQLLVDSYMCGECDNSPEDVADAKLGLELIARGEGIELNRSRTLGHMKEDFKEAKGLESSVTVEFSDGTEEVYKGDAYPEDED